MRQSDQMIFDFPAQEPQDAHDFIIHDGNRLAYDWIMRWPGWPVPMSVLVGPARSGKSHLASIWATRSQACYLDLRVDQPAQGLLNQWLMEGDDNIQQSRSWIIDMGSVSQAFDQPAEEFLFHLYNRSYRGQASVLFLALAYPHRWSVVLPDLQSRLRSLPVISIAEPDDGLLFKIIRQQFEYKQVIVSDQVIQYVLTHAPRTAQFLMRLVDQLDRRSLQDKQPVTIPMVRQILDHMDQGPLS